MKRVILFACFLAAGSLSVHTAFAASEESGTEPQTNRELIQAESMQRYYETKGPDWGVGAAAQPGDLPNISQQFPTNNLPDEIRINPQTLDQNIKSIQPRLSSVRIKGLKVRADGKTVEFSLENTFHRPHSQPIRIGGLMLSGMVRYDYDNGATLHNAVLYKENRLELDRKSRDFVTDPQTYPSVRSIESLRFFLTPPIASLMQSASKSIASINVPAGTPDVSQEFSVNKLPKLIVLDPNTIDQHAASRDPRLEYLHIRNLRIGADGKTVEFNIQNNYNRKLREPIHIGELMLTAKARYTFDNGEKLHSCIILSIKHAVLSRGDNYFTTDPSLYPDVTRLETVQFFFGIR